MVRPNKSIDRERLRCPTRIGVVAALLLVGSGLAASGSEYEAGEVQVILAPGVPVGVINARYGTTTLDSLPPLYLLDLPDGTGEDEVVDPMQEDPDIVEVEYSWEDETPEGTRQMVVSAVGGTIEDYLDQNVVGRIHLAEIHRHTQGDGILVAVIDTGVLASHPALAGAIAPGGYDFVDGDDDPADAANGIDDDGDGTTDEGAGHGTMVAGIIHLVAPNARILPIRVLDDEGRGGTFDVARAIRYAVGQGAQVINLSLGLTDHSSIIGHEVELADSVSVPMVSAAGNLGTDSLEYYPASDSHVLSVAALDSSDVKADFSNWKSSVAISAPGVGILAPYYDGEYAIGAGTSFSVPFIAGQCALIQALNPSLTIDQVYEVVRQGVVDIYSIPGNEQYVGELGSGRIDGWETWLHTPPAAGMGLSGSEPYPRALTIGPNPAVSGIPITIRLVARQRGGPLLATIYDAQGRVLRSLSGPGDGGGSLRWDGFDQRGKRVPAGVYFLHVVGGSNPAETHRAHLIVLRP